MSTTQSTMITLDEIKFSIQVAYTTYVNLSDNAESAREEVEKAINFYSAQIAAYAKIMDTPKYHFGGVYSKGHNLKIAKSSIIKAIANIENARNYAAYASLAAEDAYRHFIELTNTLN